MTGNRGTVLAHILIKFNYRIEKSSENKGRSQEIIQERSNFIRLELSRADCIEISRFIRVKKLSKCYPF